MRSATTVPVIQGEYDLVGAALMSGANVGGVDQYGILPTIRVGAEHLEYHELG
jgi:hypothetical protein